MLRITNFTKTYGEKVAVDNLSLTVEKGQILAFIGHNGAGKTTTLKAIAGIIEFDQGQILVDGIDVIKNPMQTKKLIAYLPDNPQLYEHLTGIEYLNFIANVFGVSSQERQSLVEDYAKRLNIYNDLSSTISSYSHGMKQKLALVSALIHKPKLILLDEPFVGLDPTASHQVKLIMKTLASEGCTFFFSTHVLEVAEKLCSHVAIIKDGKLVTHGTMDEVKGLNSLESIFLELEKGSQNEVDS